MNGTFTRPLPVHIAACAAIAIMFIQDTGFLGGRTAITMLVTVEALAIALHGFAWARAKRFSFGAQSILVLLGLFGPLYTFAFFSLYIFDTSDDPLIRIFPPLVVAICLIDMWQALKPFRERAKPDGK